MCFVYDKSCQNYFTETSLCASLAVQTVLWKREISWCGRPFMMTSFHTADLCWPPTRREPLPPSSSCLVGRLPKQETSVYPLRMCVKLWVWLSIWSNPPLYRHPFATLWAASQNSALTLKQFWKRADLIARMRGVWEVECNSLMHNFLEEQGKDASRLWGPLPKDRSLSWMGKTSFFYGCLQNCLIQNIPRELRALDGHNAVIFTDACYERGKSEWPCGIGGVLFFMGQVSFFSVEVLALARTALGEQRKKQIIFEAETLAAVVAFRLWAPSLSNRTEMYSFCWQWGLQVCLVAWCL